MPSEVTGRVTRIAGTFGTAWRAKEALVIIAADVVALYGLCAYGSHANLEAA